RREPRQRRAARRLSAGRRSPGGRGSCGPRPTRAFSFSWAVDPGTIGRFAVAGRRRPAGFRPVPGGGARRERSMLVRCSWCEKDFHSDRYGRQFCPHCGAELDLPAPAAQEAVPTPRTLQPGEGGGPGGAGGGGFGGPPGGGGFGEGPPQDEDAPWEQRDRLGFLPALVETWKRASLDPKAFYARLRTTGIGDAFLYGLILSTLGTALAAIWSLVLSGFTGEDPVVGLGQLVASPIFAAIGLFVGAGLVHLGCMVFGCANRGFDATFRAVAYAQGPQI